MFKVQTFQIILLLHNINSVRNKLDQLKNIQVNSVNVLMIAKIKLNETFPDSQFKIPGMEKPYCLDVTANRWGGVWGRRLFWKLLRTDTQAILYEIKTN